MRQKILYFSFLFIMIFLLVFLNKKPKIIQPVEEKGKEQAASSENINLLENNNSTSLFSNKAGVAFIKKNPNESHSEKSLLPDATSSFRTETVAQNSGSSGEGRIESSNKTDDANKDESSGITKISKRPTEERKQQLTKDGILIF